MDFVWPAAKYAWQAGLACVRGGNLQRCPSVTIRAAEASDQPAPSYFWIVVLVNELLFMGLVLWYLCGSWGATVLALAPTDHALPFVVLICTVDADIHEDNYSCEGWHFDGKFMIIGLNPAPRWKLRLVFPELRRRGEGGKEKEKELDWVAPIESEVEERNEAAESLDLASRARRRRAKFSPGARWQGASQRSVLELRAAGSPTALDYQARLEEALLEHFNQFYFDGHDVPDGAKLAAAAAHFRLDLPPKLGNLPRAQRALSAGAAEGATAPALAGGGVDGQLARPKTRDYDVSLLLDNPEFSWVDRALGHLVNGRNAEQPLPMLDMRGWTRAFHQAVIALQLEALGPPVLRQLRRGGVGHETLANAREIGDIEKRGRWEARSRARVCAPPFPAVPRGRSMALEFDVAEWQRELLDAERRADAAGDASAVEELQSAWFWRAAPPPPTASATTTG
ncbi:unnamed protein product, partial [Prorocentrum cordatum]